MTSIKINLGFSRAKTELSRVGIKLLDHQVDALKWMIHREKDSESECQGGIIADDMGLGKTLEAISLILSRPVKRTLLVVPANLIEQWLGEFDKFAPGLTVLTHQTGFTDEDSTGEGHPFIYISSYIRAIRSDFIRGMRWNRVILDEAHYIRNSKGVVHKNIVRIKAKYRWALTGTPIQNYYTDLVSIFDYLGIHLDEDIRCREEKMEEIKDLADTYILRRTKEGLQFPMPPIEISTIKVEYKSLYEKMFYKKLEQNSFLKADFHHLELLLRLRQATILPQLVHDGYVKKLNGEKEKIEWKYSNSKLDTIVQTIVDNPDEKPLVFCFFIKEMEYLKEKLDKAGISYGVINGSVGMAERQSVIQNASEYKVLILQMMAGSTGLNLQEFNAVHFTGPHWNPTHEQQAIARVYRLGQKNKVVVRKYIMSKTIEEVIVRIQDAKNDLINSMLE